MRVITDEILREQELKPLRQEIPHGIGVEIERIELREDGINDINAVIYCERDSHKGIIIGGRGAMLKRIGSAARPEIETLFGTKVNLQLWVKVRPDWRNSANALRELGYNDD
jgi:GTP-binding protein Era